MSATADGSAITAWTTDDLEFIADLMYYHIASEWRESDRLPSVVEAIRFIREGFGLSLGDGIYCADVMCRNYEDVLKIMGFYQDPPKRYLH